MKNLKLILALLCVFPLSCEAAPKKPKPVIYDSVTGILIEPSSALFQSANGIGGGSGSVATDTLWDAVGDLAVGSGANTALRLPIGTALQTLRVNAGATGLEWAAAGTGDALVSGTLDQFANVTQTAGQTLSITASTTLGGGTMARKDAGQTFNGEQSFLSYINAGGEDVAAALRLYSGTGFNNTEFATLSTGINVVTFPDATGTVVLLESSNMWQQPQTFSSSSLIFRNVADTFSTTIANTATADRTLTLPDGTDTLVGRATTDTLTFKTINGANNTITNVSLTTGVTGTLPVANGGTGATTLATNNVLLGNGTGAIQVVAPGTAGNVLTSNGTTWQSTAAVSGDNRQVVSADVVNSTTSFADITGLTFPVVSGETYVFEATICFTSALTTTGSKWSVNGPASPTFVSFKAESATTATSSRIDYGDSYDTGGPSAQTPNQTNLHARVEGIVKVSANGTFAIRFGSEVATSAITVKAGSTLVWKKVLP